MGREAPSFGGRGVILKILLWRIIHIAWITIFLPYDFSYIFERASSGQSSFWLRLTRCLISLSAAHLNACYRKSAPKDCMHVKSFINNWHNFQRLVNERLSPWEQVQSYNLHASGKVMSAKMSQSALDINENMLLDIANGSLQREDAVRFGTSQTIVSIIKRCSQNLENTQD